MTENYGEKILRDDIKYNFRQRGYVYIIKQFVKKYGDKSAKEIIDMLAKERRKDRKDIRAKEIIKIKNIVKQFKDKSNEEIENIFIDNQMKGLEDFIKFDDQERERRPRRSRRYKSRLERRIKGKQKTI
ncbi:MAG TPA: hypothetical protein PKY81_10840 [bacterium]|nr:hypothetical protein [bacterium]